MLFFTVTSSRRISSKTNLRALEETNELSSVGTQMGGSDPAMTDFIHAIENAEAQEEEEGQNVERVSPRSCWSYCDQGKCDWSAKGCNCMCKDNFSGTCCTKMIACGQNTKKCCPRHNLKPQKAKCSTLFEDVRDDKHTLVLGTAAMGLSEDKQGIFWLTKQGAKSSLMSFARTNDGCGIADAHTKKEGSDPFTKENPFRIRVAGDRTWSDGGGFDSGTFKAAAALDLVYNFIEETAGKIVIIPQVTRSFFNIKVARWLLEFRADLLDPSQVSVHESPYTTKPDGSANSAVWRRTSNAFFNLHSLGGAGQYDLVQVLDGNGEKLQPAYDDFVNGCSNWKGLNENGEMFWRERNTHPSTQGGAERVVYGRGEETAANDEYYFRVASV